MMQLLKRVSALLLAVSFFLPLTQCSQKLGDTSPPVTVSASNAYEWPSLLSAVVLLLFFWPLVLQLWSAIKRIRITSRKASWIEFGLSILSLAGIAGIALPWMLTFGASIRYGAFVASGSVLAYGTASLVEAVQTGTRPLRRGGQVSRPDSPI
ncbi:hypothetical protein [Dyella nitratireducens]|nr:hypothetical protein [Dyella nitratireducens]